MWDLAGAVILSGLVLVFLILCILIGVVTLTGRLTGASRKPEKPTAAKENPPPAVAAAPLLPSPPPVVEAGISGETVAVISAAVAALMDEESPGGEYAVTQVRRARDPRPVWGFAGMQQNTRPF